MKIFNREKKPKLTEEDVINNAISEGKKRFILKVPIGTERIPTSGGLYEILFGNSFMCTLKEFTPSPMKFQKENGEEFWIGRKDLFGYSKCTDKSQLKDEMNYYKIDTIID